MLPFLVLASVYGWQRILPCLATRRAVTGVLAAAVLIECAGFFSNLYHYWPQRSALAFEAGLGPAIVEAHRLAGTQHEVVLSDNFEAPYIFAYFWLQADPHAVAAHGLSALDMRVGSVASAKPGDIVVVSPQDKPPAGATEVWTYTVTEDSPVDLLGQPSSTTLVTASVWRR
jgi:hypothetical protein